MTCRVCLVRGRFIIASDMPVAVTAGNTWDRLSPTSQKRMERDDNSEPHSNSLIVELILRCTKAAQSHTGQDASQGQRLDLLIALSPLSSLPDSVHQMTIVYTYSLQRLLLSQGEYVSSLYLHTCECIPDCAFVIDGGQTTTNVN